MELTLAQDAKIWVLWKAWRKKQITRIEYANACWDVSKGYIIGGDH